MYSSSFSRSTKEEQHRDPSTNKLESSGLPTGSFDTSELLESLSGTPCNFLREQIQEVSRALFSDTDLLDSDDLDARLNLIAMALLQHGEGVSSEDRALALVSFLTRAVCS